MNDQQKQAARIVETADSHMKADIACGRDWTCQCGACRIVRRELGGQTDPSRTEDK